MIYHEMPRDFQPKFEVVSCFCEQDGQIALLLRQDFKDRGNLWGVPAGRMEVGETPVGAMTRELVEETTLIRQPTDLDHVHTVYIRYPDYDFTFHIFRTPMQSDETILFNKAEHKALTWVRPSDALTMDLVPDQDACIRLVYPLSDTA